MYILMYLLYITNEANTLAEPGLLLKDKSPDKTFLRPQKEEEIAEKEK